MKKLGIILTVVSGMLFGIVPLIVTIAYDHGYNAFSVGFYRNFFALPFLVALNRYRKLDIRVEKRDIKSILFIGVFGIAATSLFLNLSYKYVSIGIATTLHFMYPMFVCFVSAVFLKEKLTKEKIVCLAASFLGVILFADLSNASGMVGMGIAILSGFTYSMYIVMMSKTGIMTRSNPLTISMYFSFISSLIFLALSLLFNGFKIPTSFIDFIILVSIALFCQVLATVFMQLGILYIGPSNAALFSLLEPLTSNIVGIIFLHDTITYKKIIGCLLIFYSVLELSNSTLRSQKNKKS